MNAVIDQIEIDREIFTRNEVVVDGKRIYSRAEAQSIDMQIAGEGNVFRLHRPVGRGTLRILCRPGTRDCRLDFGANNKISRDLVIHFHESVGRCADRSSVIIGSDNNFNGNVFIFAGLMPSTVVEIGSENLFADGIYITGGIEHLIYNIDTMEPENIERGIKIGSRVWLCREVQIFNKSEIPSNTVVAARAITNRKFEESHTMIAGAPARVTKRRIMWHFSTTDEYLTAEGPFDMHRSEN